MSRNLLRRVTEATTKRKSSREVKRCSQREQFRSRLDSLRGTENIIYNAVDTRASCERINNHTQLRDIKKKVQYPTFDFYYLETVLTRIREL